MSDEKSDKTNNKTSLQHKYDIVCKLEDGVKRKQLLIEYKLKSYANLKHIWRKKEIILKYNQLSAKSSKKSFRLSKAKYPEVEEALVEEYL
jgi:hypothetical protein